MITSDFGRRVFALEVGGLSVRYLSDNVDVSSSNLDLNLASGIPYTNQEGISQVGSYQANIDPAGGIANYAAVSIVLSTNRLRGSLSDPHVIFGRCGPKSTDISKAQIQTNIYHNETSVTVTVDSDLTSLSFPRLMHIGAETVLVSSATASNISVTGRGVGRTPKQNHIIDQGGTNVPEVYSDIVSFRGRKASLWMAQKRPDGSISDFTEIINGFIESSPTIENGDSITLSLIPLTALIDNSISETTLKTSLVHNYHNFDDIAGAKLEYAVICTQSESFRITGDTSSPNLTFASSDLPLDHSNIFDTSLTPANNGTYYIHPRYPEIVNSDGRLFPTALSSTGLTYDNTDLTYNNLVPSVSSTKRVQVRTPRGEIKSYKITNGIQRFPEIINTVLSANSTGSAQGVNGSFVDWKISDNNSLMIKSNAGYQTANSSIAFFSSQEALRQVEQLFLCPPLGIWSSNIVGINPTQNLERLYYPLDLWFQNGLPDDPVLQEGGIDERIHHSFEALPAPNLKNQSRKYTIRGIAKAYYQNGESTILVKDNLGLPLSPAAGVSYDIEVTYYDKKQDEILSQFFPITHQSVASFGGSAIGYLLHIEEPFSSSRRSSFGDWEGLEPTQIYLSTRLNFLTPGEAILRLLQSGGGDSINGAYDQSSIGLNIDESEIDVNSFLQYESIPNIMINLDLRSEGQDFRKALTPLLQSMGAVLVMRRTRDGRSKIALQPLGMDQKNAASITIQNGDWLADNPPIWDIYEDIVTQVEINFDYDIVEQKLRTRRIFNNQEAINRYGGEKSKITLDLFGVSSNQIGGSAGDSYSFFLPIVSRIFALLSNPLRLWRGSIGTGQSALIDIGRYALVNSDHLKGYGPEYGVENGVGFIKSIRQELMLEGCEIEILTTGSKSAGWNDSAKVLSIPASNSVTIDQDVFSKTNLIGESVKDSSFFKVGDLVDYVLDGDHDNSILKLNIASIVDNGSTATITFTSAHSITTTGGTLEPTFYTFASIDQKLDAYISTAAGVLGSSDDGKEYA